MSIRTCLLEVDVVMRVVKVAQAIVVVGPQTSITHLGSFKGIPGNAT